MASCRGTNVIACLRLIVVMVGLMKGAAAKEYIVGDSLGWTLPPNSSFYSDWAASKTFQIGDTVLFNSTGNHTFAEVNSKQEYDNCSDPPIWNIPGLSANLVSAGSRYFFCTVGNHCEQGMKVTITVNSSTATSATPPPPSGAHASVASLLLVLFSSTLVISFFAYM